VATAGVPACSVTWLWLLLLLLLLLLSQVSLFDLSLLTSHCKSLKYLELLGLWEAGGALQCLLPWQLLVPPDVLSSILQCEFGGGGGQCELRRGGGGGGSV
jgi:hypothetical protein